MEKRKSKVNDKQIKEMIKKDIKTKMSNIHKIDMEALACNLSSDSDFDRNENNNDGNYGEDEEGFDEAFNEHKD